MAVDDDQQMLSNLRFSIFDFYRFPWAGAYFGPFYGRIADEIMKSLVLLSADRMEEEGMAGSSST
jgi:hypothetical protein